jgi:hypothetical protein
MRSILALALLICLATIIGCGSSSTTAPAGGGGGGSSPAKNKSNTAIE